MGQGALSAPHVYDNSHHVLYRSFRFLQPYNISRSHHRHTLLFQFAIFPLILIYIEGLVQKDPSYKRALLYLLPAFACGISAGLIYATMSDEEFSEFIGYHYYFQNYNSISGSAWWLVFIHRAFRIITAMEIPLVLYFGWK